MAQFVGCVEAPSLCRFERVEEHERNAVAPHRECVDLGMVGNE
jgi:hypothetical protein